MQAMIPPQADLSMLASLMDLLRNPDATKKHIAELAATVAEYAKAKEASEQSLKVANERWRALDAAELEHHKAVQEANRQRAQFERERNANNAEIAKIQDNLSKYERDLEARKAELDDKDDELSTFAEALRERDAMLREDEVRIANMRKDLEARLARIREAAA